MSLPKPYYQDEWVTIYHGDCRGILPELPKVDLVLTDPPYGLNSKMSGGTWGVAHHHGDMLDWDYLINQEDLNKVLSWGRIKIVWGGNNYNLPPSRCWLAWIKPHFPTLSDVELAWTNMDKPAKWYLSNRLSQANKHPTEKPLGLMEWSIVQANSIETICDPFMGSGTTLLASKKLNRKCIGIEIEEKYCEIAAKRCSQGVFDLTKVGVND